MAVSWISEAGNTCPGVGCVLTFLTWIGGAAFMPVEKTPLSEVEFDYVFVVEGV